MEKIKRFKWPLVVAIVLVLALVLIFSLRISAKDRVISGVIFDGEEIAGISYTEVESLVSQKAEEFKSSQFSFELDGEIKNVNFTDLGIDIDVQATTDLINKESYGSGMIDHLGNRLQTTFSEINVLPVYTVNQEQFQKTLVQNYPELEGAKDAEVLTEVLTNETNAELVEFQVNVAEHRDGFLTDLDILSQNVVDQLNEEALENTLTIEAKADPAQYTTAQAQADAEILNSHLGREIRFFYHDSFRLIYENYLKVYPEWLSVKNGQTTVKREAFDSLLTTYIAPEVETPVQNAVLKELPTKLNKAASEIVPEDHYAVVEGVAIDGYEINRDQAFADLERVLLGPGIEVLEDGTEVPVAQEVPLQLDRVRAQVINETGEDLGEFEHLGTGSSDYLHSAYGRAFNIEMGINDKVNNVYLEPGEEYSFNALLGPVTYGAGWKASKAIFKGGEELKDVPGGGLCQVSTTVYRAALKAGMEITDRRPHSLYVGYYEERGNGLDATIYQGGQDLKFKNNTPGPVLIQAYTTEFNETYVKFYGTDDGREVELIGPFYRSSEVPEEYQDRINPGWAQIQWIQKITNPDGSITENVLSATYNKGSVRAVYGDQDINDY